PRVTPIHAFLGATDVDAAPHDVYSSWPLRGADLELHPRHLGQPMETDRATTRSIDSIIADLGLGTVDFVKLDVDGHECAVLSGASHLLAHVRPTFLLELAPYVHCERGYSFDRFLRYFWANGYQLHDCRSGRALPEDSAKLSAIIGDGAGVN